MEDSVRINRPPEAVFEWFSHFVENYRSWHQDHVKAVWLEGDDLEKGSVLYAEEYLGDKLEKLSFKITDRIQNELIAYRMSFPESIICSGGTFSIRPSNGGSIFTATLFFRFGWLLSKIAKNRIQVIEIHMKEEGENLKKILEKID